MAISFERYVRITSGVGAGATVRRRELIARFFTNSTLSPTNTVLEFTTADDVGEFYGTTSGEFSRAQFYFGFVSKNITRPQRISFARWVDADSAPQVYGADSHPLNNLKAITAGTFFLTLGSTRFSVTGINFSSANSFADVASTLQTRIRTGTGAIFTQATVTYDAPNSRFIITGGATGTANVLVEAGSTNDAAGALGLLTGAVLSPGFDAETVSATLARSAELTNNFGSFAFVPTLTTARITEAARWNSTQNNLYQYHVQVTPANAATVSAAIRGFAGSGMTLNRANLSDQYPEVLPMAILAATNYNNRAAVQNYMFQVSASLTPTVTTNADANLYDPLRINYYGETQTAGQLLRFYQRGVLGGGTTAAVNMNTYANEQWLKDDAGSRIMSLLLSLPTVSANRRGRGQVLTILRGTINQALLNGVISVGRTLNDNQKLFINEQTGNPDAFQQVQTSGLWVDAVLEAFTTTDNRTEFRASYTLIYAQDEAIRMVEGRHVLI